MYLHSTAQDRHRPSCPVVCFMLLCGFIYYSVGSYLRPFSAPDQLAYIFDFYSPLLQLSHNLFAPSEHASPTLYYALLKGIHQLFNHQLWLYRLPNLLLCLITAFATGAAARHSWQGAAGNIATLIMITFVGSYVGAQSISPQMFAASLSGLAVLCFFTHLRCKKSCTLWYGYGLLALSYTIGGLFALLAPMAMALGWLVLTRKKWTWHCLRPHGGALLIPIALVAWHYAAPNPQGDWIQGWTPLLNTFKQTHYLLGWPFLLDFIVVFLPFGVFIMNSLWFSKNPLWQAHGATPQQRLLLQLWIVAPLVVCVLCKPYTGLWLMTSAPAIALCLAPYFHCIWEKKAIPNFYIPIQLLLGLSLFTLLTLGLMAFHKRFLPIPAIHTPWIQGLTAFLIVVTLAGIGLLYRRAFWMYFYGLVALSVSYTLGLTLIYAELQNKPLRFHFLPVLDTPLQEGSATNDELNTHAHYCPRLTSALHG